MANSTITNNCEESTNMKSTVWRGNQLISVSPSTICRFDEGIQLRQDLMRGLYSLGFNKPYIVQKYVLPLLLNGRRDNVEVYAESKSGKTTAALISILYWLAQHKSKKMLIVHRSCDSAEKSHFTLKKMSKFMSEVRIRLLIRGQHHVGKVAENIIVGTSDKMYELIKEGNYLNRETIGMIVFDEIIDFSCSVHQLIALGQELKPECQVVWLSSLEDEKVSGVGLGKFMLYPTKIRCIERVKRSIPAEKQNFVACRNRDEKLQVLKLISLYYKQAIIVCTKNDDASNVTQLLRNKQWANTDLLSGKLKNLNDRRSILEKFMDGKIKVLVTTPHFLEEAAKANVGIVLNYGILVSKENKFDYNQYQKRQDLLVSQKRDILVLSIVDERWEPYLNSSDAAIILLEMSSLNQLLSN